MSKMYRFTDWYDEGKDEVGTYRECKKIFDKAVEENPEGRFSIYDTDTDEGVLFNEKCPEYSLTDEERKSERKAERKSAKK